MSVLTIDQRREIRLAVQEIHADLRWSVGDHPDLPRLLELLATTMFLSGLSSRTPENPPVIPGLEKP